MRKLLIREIQDLIDIGELDKALESLRSFPAEMSIEGDLYTGLILIAKGKYQVAIDYAQKALNNAKAVERRSDVQRANIIKSYALENLGKWDDAYQLLTNIVQVIEDLPPIEQELLQYFRTVLFKAKGIVETRIGKRQEAYESYQTALTIAQRLGRNSLLGALYNNIGHICTQLGQTKDAFRNYEKSLSIADELDNDYNRYYPLSNFGIYYYNHGEMEKAYEYHIQALEIAEKIDNKSNIASQYREISQIYRMKGRLEEALEYLQDSLKIRKEIGNPIWITFTLVYLIETTLDMGNVELAHTYSNELKQYNSKSTSRLINQITRMSSGLIYKKSPRLKDKAAAIDIFRRIVDEDIIDYDTTINSILHLCDLLLFELKLTNEEEVLIEIHFLTAKLIQIAEANNSHTLICEILGLQSSIALIEGNLELALKLLDEAVSIAKKHESFNLEKKFSLIKGELIKQSEQWHQSIDGESSLGDRMHLSNVEDYLQDIIKIKDNLFQK